MITSQFLDTADSVPFPRLMYSLARPSLVVLFAEPTMGTVIAVGEDEEIYFVGDHSTDWDPSGFELFTGGLQLSNEVELSEEGVVRIKDQLFAELGNLCGLPGAAPDQVMGEIIQAMAQRHGATTGPAPAEQFAASFAQFVQDVKTQGQAMAAAAAADQTGTSANDESADGFGSHVFVFRGDGSGQPPEALKQVLEMLMSGGAVFGGPSNEAGQESKRG